MLKFETEKSLRRAAFSFHVRDVSISGVRFVDNGERSHSIRLMRGDLHER